MSNEEILANTVAVTLFKITTQVAKLHIHYCKDKTTWSDMGFLIIEMWEFGEHTNTHTQIRTHSHTQMYASSKARPLLNHPPFCLKAKTGHNNRLPTYQHWGSGADTFADTNTLRHTQTRTHKHIHKIATPTHLWIRPLLSSFQVDAMHNTILPTKDVHHRSKMAKSRESFMEGASVLPSSPIEDW